ncbi:NUDIX hydrolase domain-like protein [Trametes gibbosa]|nr:NUDIX hydrolase domain-like protein [Trametes gibbosa]
MPTKRGDGSGLRLLQFHRPQFDLSEAPIPELTPESRRCIQTLATYRTPKAPLRYPKSRIAAVLVALFVGRTGDLYVLLSRRASSLRTYAGDTALPGGKWEPRDKSIEWTARREACEEIGLPPDYKRVPLLCVLEPFLAGNKLIVTPVVVLVLDKTLRPILNGAEVVSLFSHPLASLLSSEPPFPLEPEMLEIKYHTYSDYTSSSAPGKIRMHNFLTGREAGGTKPIFGLTASILIKVATIGYGREPDFEPYAPGEPTTQQRIAHALRHDPVFREAERAENIDPDKTPDPSSLGESHKSAAEVKHRRRRRPFGGRQLVRAKL